MGKSTMRTGFILLTILITMTFVYRQVLREKEDYSYKEIFISELNEISQEKSYIVLHTPECITCRKLKKDISELNDENFNVDNIYWMDIDKAENKSYKEIFDINGTPTIVLFSKREIVDVLSGGIDKEKLKLFLQ